MGYGLHGRVRRNHLMLQRRVRALSQRQVPQARACVRKRHAPLQGGDALEQEEYDLIGEIVECGGRFARHRGCVHVRVPMSVLSKTMKRHRHRFVLRTLVETANGTQMNPAVIAAIDTFAPMTMVNPFTSDPRR